MTTISASSPITSTLNPLVIATHDGVFHADDVLAVACLLILNPTAELVRTRDSLRISRADVVVDVGGVYDIATERFDHHQRNRAGARENGVMFSSFGLVWWHYSSRIMAALGVPEAHYSAVGGKVDTDLVQPIDAIDNGQNLYAGGQPVFAGVASVSLSAVLSGFNPGWHQESKDFDAAFGQAVAVAQSIVRNAVQSALGEALALSGVRDAIIESADGPIVVLKAFMPWGDQVRENAPRALFCVFPSETGTWMVQAVNAKAGTFESRKLLPELWAGLRGQEFASVVGFAPAVFCHPGRFICGFETKTAALAAAKMAVLSH